MSAPSYTSLSEFNEDDQLLSTTGIDMNSQAARFPDVWSVTFNTTLFPRVISTALSLTSFIIFCRDRNDAYIAADIFLMLTILYNIVMALYHFPNVLKITVELPRHAWKGETVPRRPLKNSPYIDRVGSFITFLCVLLGTMFSDESRDACIVAYFAVLMQAVCGISNSKNITLSVKFFDLQGKVPLDSKLPTIVDESGRGSTKRRTTGSEEPRSAEALV